MTIDYIVIGGGPVGLLTSLLLKGENKNVLIFEKREEYNRSQYIYLNLKSTHLNLIRDEELKLFLQQIKTSIRICELELTLRNFCNQRGVPIINHKVTSIDEVITMYPSSNIIAADGANSIFRLNGCDKNEQHFLSLHIQVKYRDNQLDNQSDNSVSPLLPSNLYCFLKNIELAGFELVTNNVCTFIFILPKEYFHFSSVVKKWTISSVNNNTTELPTKLFQLIQKYILLREELNLNNGSIGYTIDISFYPLSTQRTTYFAYNYTNYSNDTNKNQTKLFLVGDAALSLPYFRGLSFGFYSAILLTNFISKDEDYKYHKKMVEETSLQLIKSEEFTGLIHIINLFFIVANNNCFQFINFDPSVVQKLNQCIMIDN
jgi:hypothetical protein